MQGLRLFTRRRSSSSQGAAARPKIFPARNDRIIYNTREATLPAIIADPRVLGTVPGNVSKRLLETWVRELVLKHIHEDQAIANVIAQRVVVSSDSEEVLTWNFQYFCNIVDGSFTSNTKIRHTDEVPDEAIGKGRMRQRGPK